MLPCKDCVILAICRAHLIQRQSENQIYAYDASNYNYELMLDLIQSCVLLRDYIPAEVEGRPRGIYDWSKAQKILNVSKKEWEQRIAYLFDFYDDLLMEED